ncbi:hypothetical protein [Peribacillus kribbensis]|uniref:hypothetical protein n=1 Tax=Peribacillus kribbensis TaxID=356658 RepID=UPI00047D3F1D|nr:hypothetical protein [Peribacillus kribbensis]
MSEHQQYVLEREQIDDLLQKGYKIKKVIESLSGDIVQFEQDSNTEEEPTKEILLILTPNARKYFSVKLIEQAQGNVQL